MAGAAIANAARSHLDHPKVTACNIPGAHVGGAAGSWVTAFMAPSMEKKGENRARAAS